LQEWENFYNSHRPHGAFKGKSPYEQKPLRAIAQQV
jgi:transposase InsO family protein